MSNVSFGLDVGHSTACLAVSKVRREIRKDFQDFLKPVIRISEFLCSEIRSIFKYVPHQFAFLFGGKNCRLEEILFAFFPIENRFGLTKV